MLLVRQWLPLGQRLLDTWSIVAGQFPIDKYPVDMGYTFCLQQNRMFQQHRALNCWKTKINSTAASVRICSVNSTPKHLPQSGTITTWPMGQAYSDDRSNEAGSGTVFGRMSCTANWSSSRMSFCSSVRTSDRSPVVEWSTGSLQWFIISSVKFKFLFKNRAKRKMFH